MTAQPYPWAALDRVSREDAMVARAMRRWGAQFAHEEAITRAASEILGARVRARVTSVRSARIALGTVARSDADVAVILARDRANLSHAWLIEAEGALAAALVGRAVRRDVPRVFNPAAGASPALAGALAAIVSAVARRTRVDRAPQVVAAGPANVLVRDLAASAGELLEATLTVLIDDEAFVARVFAPRATAMAAAGAPWTATTLSTLGDVRLAMPIVAAATLATAADVASLRVGDAWIPGEWRLTRTASGTFAGRVLLAAPAHEVGFQADLGEDGRLVLGGGVECLAWSADGGDVVSEAERETLVTAMGEVPVVVRVEVGTVEMAAKDWAALGQGDVIALGRKVGDGVTLRVGGVAVARGELVDLEGEVGVRILGRPEAP